MSVLKQITNEAKRIRKKNPRTTWKSAVKQAGAKYRSKKTSAPKKKRASVSGIKKPRVQVATAANVGRVPGSAVALKSGLKSHYKIDLGNALMRRELAKTKTEKKQLAKKIHSLKKAINFLS